MARKKGQRSLAGKKRRSAERGKEGEEGKDQTVVVQRRCINPASAEAFDIFLPGEIRRIMRIPGVIFGEILVVCLSVILWPCRVCLL